jgi:hypothetical protein
MISALCGFTGLLVSLQIDGQRLVNARTRLEKVLGEKVAISRSLANEPIILKVKDVTQEELMLKMATVFNATWKRETTGWKFFQTPGQIKQERTKHEQLIRKKFESIVSEAASEQKNAPKFDKAYATELRNEIFNYQNAISKLSHYESNPNILELHPKKTHPEARLCQSVLAQLPVRQLLLINRNSPELFLSTLSNRSDTFLDIDLTNPANQFYKDTSIGNDVLKRLPLSNNSYETPKIDRVVKSADIQVNYNLTEIEIYVSVYDQDNEYIAGDISSIDIISDEDNDKDVFDKKDFIIPKFSTTATNLLEIYKGTVAKRDVPSQFLNFSNFDLSSFCAAPSFIDFAGDKNIIARPTDLSSFDTDYFPQFAAGRKQYNIGLTEKWLTFSPVDRYDQKEISVDRPMLDQFTKQFRSRPFTLIDDQANLFRLIPWQSYGDFYVHFLPPLVPSDFYSTDNNESDVRIYGSLDTKQREQASTAQGIRFANLNPDTRFLLTNRLLTQFLRPRNRPQWEPTRANPFDKNPKPLDDNDLSFLPKEFRRDFERNPHLAFPNGLPNSCSLKINVTYDDAILATSEEEEFSYTSSYTPAVIGRILFNLESNKTSENFLNMLKKINLNSLRLSRRKVVEMKLVINPFATVSWTLLEHPPISDATYTLKTLPADIRAEIAKNYERIKAKKKSTPK